MKLLFITLTFFVSMTTAKACDTVPVLHHLVREPIVKSANAPVIILLHGVGSNEEDLFSLANHLPDNFLVISARAPIGLEENSFAWYQVDFSTGKPVFNVAQQENSRAILIKFIDQIKEKYAVSGNVYLGGFSQGAIMSYSVGLTRPDLVNGIVVMSGRLLEETKPMVAANDNLKTLGINPTYKEYPETHTISNDMLIDLVKWLKGN